MAHGDSPLNVPSTRAVDPQQLLPPSQALIPLTQASSQGRLGLHRQRPRELISIFFSPPGKIFIETVQSKASSSGAESVACRHSDLGWGELSQAVKKTAGPGRGCLETPRRTAERRVLQCEDGQPGKVLALCAADVFYWLMPL